MTVIGGHAKYSFTVELRDTGRYGFILPEDQVNFSFNALLRSTIDFKLYLGNIFIN